MKISGIFAAGALMATLCLAGPSKANASCTEPVNTTSGMVRGASDENSYTCSWKGIPFAEPPTGELRWKAPRPEPSWTGVRDATRFSRQCMQVPSMLSDKKLGISEDCLYLNIWAPRKSGTFPVMFWIHGGGLNDGTAAIPMYYGENLAGQKDVLLVSINYRLGPFGFYALPEFADENAHASAGNYGLQDQVRALEWVRDNIAAFGGDPDNVTIFGESAGGRSVCSLLACPLARGLFHKAIIESGGCGAWPIEKCNTHAGRLAASLGCEGADVAACMRQKSADEIMDAVRKNRGSGPAFADDPVEFKVCVDGWVIKDVPLETIRAGAHNNVPVMVGTNRDEFKLFVLRSLPVFYQLLPASILNRLSNGRFEPAPETRSIYDELYPKSSYGLPGDRWIAGVTDVTYSCRGLAAADAIAARQPSTYYYRFDYDRHRFSHLVGAAHGTEIVYIFDTLEQEGIFNIYSRKQVKEAEPLVDIMMGYWTNFAGSGDPNGPGLPSWPAYTIDERRRMFLDLPSRAMPDQEVKEKCGFWAGQKTGEW